MDLKDFVDNLNRDKARGDIAPHQIILLLSLQKLYLENKSNVIQISDLMNVFSLTWEEHQNTFKTKNCNLGLPLRAFVNKGYIEIVTTTDIKDFRNKNELIAKITHIKINPVILKLFKNTEFASYLKTRFSS